MKKIISTFIFIAILFFFTVEIKSILQFKQRSTQSKNIFYEEKIDYDMMFLGSSSTFFDISPLYLFKKYGLLSYTLSAPGCRNDDLIALTMEAVKYKKSKLLVIEYSSLLSLPNNSIFKQGNMMSIENLLIRYNAYYKNNSDNNTINLENIIGAINPFDNNSIVSNIINNLNPFFVFHHRWKEINDKDLYADNYLRGYSSMNNKFYMSSSKEDGYMLSEIQKKYIRDYIKYIKDNNLTVVFFAPPVLLNHYIYSDSAITEFKNIIKDYNIEFINMKDTSMFDIEADLQSNVHLNFKGGKKFMDRADFVPYLMKKYNIPSHKDDPKYAYWYKDYEKQERMINKEELSYSYYLNQWSKYAFYDNYTVIISSKGDVMNKLPNEIKDFLKSHGLTKYDTNKENQKYAAIIDNNKVFYEEISNEKVEYKGRMKKVVNLEVISDKDAVIKISGKERSKNQDGLNIVVYDKINKEVVDRIWIDVNKSKIVNR